jgi:hypothetical protein
VAVGYVDHHRIHARLDEGARSAEMVLVDADGRRDGDTGVGDPFDLTGLFLDGQKPVNRPDTAGLAQCDS